MNSYTTGTRCKHLAKQKIQVAVEGCENLSPEQIADLAGQQIRREFNDVLRNIAGGQTDTYKPTEADKELVRGIEETGTFTFNIATHLAGKGTRRDEWDSIVEMTDEEILAMVRAKRDLKKGSGQEKQNSKKRPPERQQPNNEPETGTRSTSLNLRGHSAKRV
jgi:hypothetical protein